MLKVLDLFSGIGGFSLGLERTGGFETIAFCEIDPWRREKIRKIWPAVTIYEDVRTLDYAGPVNVITGGFPCQDISISGKKVGIEGERSGLWTVMCDHIGNFRPDYAIMENVPNLLRGGGGAWFGRVLSDLAKIGYDAQWHSISAASVGAGHNRERVWIIAYPHKVMWDGAFKIYNSITNQVSKCRTPGSILALLAQAEQIQFHPNEPDHRLLDGLSEAALTLAAFGDTVVPRIPEIIGNAILQGEAS